jgi:uncharacterized protein YjbI with pentapeptide repeats
MYCAAVIVLASFGCSSDSTTGTERQSESSFSAAMNSTSSSNPSGDTDTTVSTGLSRSFPIACIPNCGAEVLSNADLRGLDLSNSQWIGTDISGADFSGSDLTNAVFDGVDAFGASFEGTDLSGAILTGQFSNSVFKDTVFSEASEFGCSYFLRSDFRGSNVGSASLSCGGGEIPMSYSNFSGVDLSGKDLSSLDIQGSTFFDSDLSESTFPEQASDLDLRNANLRNADLSSAYIRGSLLWGTEVAGTRFMSEGLENIRVSALIWETIADPVLSRQDVYVFDAAQSVIPQEISSCAPNCTDMNFDGLTLKGSNISGIDFSRSSFRHTDLSEVIAIESTFVDANLDDADFRDALVYGSIFDGASFTRSQLSGCRCQKSSFQGLYDFEVQPFESNTDFRGSNFSDNDFIGVSFAAEGRSWVNLRGARFLRSNLTGVKFDIPEDLSGESVISRSFADFTDSILVNADLSFSGWYGASLRNVDLTGAIVSPSSFGYADIKGANLDRASGQSVFRASPELEESRLLDALCGYESFAGTHRDAALRESCQDSRP